MKSFLLFVFSILFLACKSDKRNTLSVDIYKESFTETSDRLIYCDTCLTGLDVFQFETNRGSQIVHNNALSLGDLIQIFGISAEEEFGKYYGDIQFWADSLLFVEVDSTKSFKILHAYSIKYDNLVDDYLAKVYFNDPRIDRHIKDYSKNEKKYHSLKSIYKNMKISLDDKFGASEENPSRLVKYYDFPILKEIRTNSTWIDFSELYKNDYTAYELSISAPLVYITGGMYAGQFVEEDSIFYDKLKLTDLHLYYEHDNIISYTELDSLFYWNMSLEEKKRRIPEKSFINYIDEILEYAPKSEDLRPTEDSFNTDLYGYRIKGILKDYDFLINHPKADSIIYSEPNRDIKYIEPVIPQKN